MRCTDHRITDCLHSKCRRERERRTSTPTLAEDVTTSLTSPVSPLHQAVYGSSDSGSSCDTSSSSSSSYDSGSSSSSCDSGSY